MKKYILLTLASLLLLTVPSVAFSLFVFPEKEVKKENIDTYGQNAHLNSVDKSNVFRVYFFASPYYSTGSELIKEDGSTVTDPLEIAEHVDNPYNSEEPYCLRHSNESGADFSNVTYNPQYPWTDVSYYYLSVESSTGANLSFNNNDTELIKRHPKRRWTGYILPNEELNIVETSKYVMIEAENNIPISKLSKIIAQSVYKDYLGFGPEFIGWTYDKALAEERSRYTIWDKYETETSGTLVGQGGAAISGTPYKIGDYGVQDVTTDQVITSSTSLSYVDNLTATGSTSIAIDGSSLNDNTIYLYPVFASKNSGKPQLINNMYTSFMKFRVNPGTNYNKKQDDEISYPNRYTIPLEQTSNNTVGGINYFTNNVYISSDETFSIQLDVDPLDYNGSWSGNWTSLLDNQAIKNLSLEEGYYGFDLYFAHAHDDYDKTIATTNVTNAVNSFNATNKYIKVIGSKNTADEYGYATINGYPLVYVIGIRKQYEYRLAGTHLSGSLDKYEDASESIIYRHNFVTVTESKTFYFTRDTSLEEDETLSLLYSKFVTSSTVSFTFTPMESTLIDFLNNQIANGNGVINNDNQVYPIGDDKPISIKADSSNKKLTVNEANRYELLFYIDLENGEPNSIQVSYRLSKSNFTLMLFSSKPALSYYSYSDLNALKNDSSFLGILTVETHTLISETTELKDKDNNIKTISQIKALYPTKEIYDSATDIKINYSLFEQSEYLLHRDTLLYFN